MSPPLLLTHGLPSRRCGKKSIACLRISAVISGAGPSIHWPRLLSPRDAQLAEAYAVEWSNVKIKLERFRPLASDLYVRPLRRR